ncbi:MAG: toll/interleukin-1 receptor domain-containing protein [Rhodobacteraceae bacterium]|nr:toll/interleukin-1 receptor domain-containing protein [Paracoccaceae bacterium]
MTARTIAFFSYTRRDDRFCGALLSTIRQTLEDAVCTYSGASLEVFQDTDDIMGGEDWRASLEKALSEALFLIPIITPSFFNSDPCRMELKRFCDKAEAMGRDDLVLPVVWVETPSLRDESARAQDELLDFIERRNWIDWSRHHSLAQMTYDLRSDVLTLARDLVQRSSAAAPAIRPTPPKSPPPPPQAAPIAASRPPSTPPSPARSSRSALAAMKRRSKSRNRWS